MTLYATRLAEESGLSRDRIRDLIAGAFLHDVGKIGIRDDILLKPGRHTEEETRGMRAHVQHGVALLGTSEWLQHARDVVESHHERFDGGGYPHGLVGEAIPLNARIFAIVDVFDALLSKRPYKEPLGFDDTMRLLERERGKHFDPALLDAFHRIAHRVYRETQEMSDATMSRAVGVLIEKYFI